MLATRVRLRPWRSREIRLVLVGVTTIVLASWLTLTPSGRVRSSSPFGPFTLTVRPSRETVTLSGTGTGFFPMRDMVFSSGSVDVTEHFAADALSASIAVTHDPFRG